jgi:hypothetical protein
MGTINEPEVQKILAIFRSKKAYPKRIYLRLADEVDISFELEKISVDTDSHHYFISIKDKDEVIHLMIPFESIHTISDALLPHGTIYYQKGE